MTSLNLSSVNAFVSAAVDGVRGMVGRRHLPHSLANEAATLTATQLLSSSSSSSPQPTTTTTTTSSATTATARTSSINARITPTPLQSNTPQASQAMLSSQMPHSQNTNITTTTTTTTTTASTQQ